MIRLPSTDVEEVGHDLGVMYMCAGAYGFVTRTWLFNALKLKAGNDQKIQPFTHGEPD